MIQPRLLTLKAPLSVVYEVTPVCDYDCAFCYAAHSRQHSHPTLERVQAILDQLAQAEVCRIIFMGGEFFLHPAWEEILAYARQRGFCTSFISNGSRLTEQTCDRLRLYAQAGAISLHGPETIHDALTRRRGTFNKALKAMQACQHSGLRVSVLYTPTQDTYLHVWDTARALAENGLLPDVLNISRLTPHGYALDCWSAIRLDLQNYLDIFSQAARIKKDFGMTVRVGDGFPKCQIPAEWRQFAGQCDAGVTLAAVGYQGDVKLCPNSPGSLGNLIHEPLGEIWRQAKPMGPLRELLWLPMPCRTCSSAPVCRSGCMVTQPNIEHFASDEIPPANHGLAGRKQCGQASHSSPPGDRATRVVAHRNPVIRPWFWPQYRMREDIPGTVIAMENGGWFLVDDVGRAIIELCDGHHTLEELEHGVAAQLKTSPNDVKERVNAMLDLLMRSGLCKEGNTEAAEALGPGHGCWERETAQQQEETWSPAGSFVSGT